MSVFYVWQKTITDAEGNIVNGADVEVRDSLTNNLATLYQDRDGLIPISNPFNAGAGGVARFYTARGFYNVTATFASDSSEYVFQDIGSASAATPDVIQYATDGDTLAANLMHILPVGSYQLPSVANVGDTVWIGKVNNAYSPTLTPSGTGTFRYPDGTVDSSFTYDIADPVKIVWGGSRWEVSYG